VKLVHLFGFITKKIVCRIVPDGVTFARDVRDVEVRRQIQNKSASFQVGK